MKISKRIANFDVFRGKRHCFPIYILFLLTTFEEVRLQGQEIVGRQVAYISGKTCRPSVGQLSADKRPTVGRLSADRRPTVGRQSADRFFGELFFTITGDSSIWYLMFFNFDSSRFNLLSSFVNSLSRARADTRRHFCRFSEIKTHWNKSFNWQVLVSNHFCTCLVAYSSRNFPFLLLEPYVAGIWGWGW